MTFAALALAYSGWLGLCAGMPKHCRDVLGRDVPHPERRFLRALGWSALALSFLCAVADVGIAIGVAKWLSALSVSGFGLVLLLPFRPRLAVGLGVLGVVAAPLAMVLWP